MSQTSNGPTGPGENQSGSGRHRIQQFAHHAGARAEHMRQAVDDLDERLRAFVRDRPGAALVGAFAIGWLVGKLASRFSR
ncbi:MAG: hypothetical protein DIU72_003575 [Pseudomonadota bacterium]|nr:MAG: hypothetical protein DIU72_05745 [Pseudomonadota bacterium]